MGLFDFFKKPDKGIKKPAIAQSDLPQSEVDVANHFTGQLIEQVFLHEAGSQEFQASYEDFLKKLYEYPYIFVALSLSQYSESTKESVPLVSTKDQGIPTIYLFSSFDIGKAWCEHYQNYNRDGYLLGILYKNQSDYQSIYRIAHSMGVERVMLDESSRFINFKVTDMIQHNHISDIIRVSSNEPVVYSDQLQFAKCSIIERQ